MAFYKDDEGALVFTRPTFFFVVRPYRGVGVTHSYHKYADYLVFTSGVVCECVSCSYLDLDLVWFFFRVAHKIFIGKANAL